MKTKKTPMRKCIGCMESKPKRELIRIAGYEGELTLDPTGKAKGRGAYLCPDISCFEKAKKKRGFQRSLEMDVSDEQLKKLFEEFIEYEKKIK